MGLMGSANGGLQVIGSWAMLYRTRKDDKRTAYQRRRTRKAVITRKLQFLLTYSAGEG